MVWHPQLERPAKAHLIPWQGERLQQVIVHRVTLCRNSLATTLQALHPAEPVVVIVENERRRVLFSRGTMHGGRTLPAALKHLQREYISCRSASTCPSRPSLLAAGLVPVVTKFCSARLKLTLTRSVNEDAAHILAYASGWCVAVAQASVSTARSIASA